MRKLAWLGLAALVAVLAFALWTVLAPGLQSEANWPGVRPATREVGGAAGEWSANAASAAESRPITPRSQDAPPRANVAGLPPGPNDGDSPRGRAAGRVLAPINRDEFVRTGYGGLSPDYRGEPVEAYVARTGPGRSKVRLDPNQDGVFQRVFIEPGEEVVVRIAYPKGAPGEKVAVTALDGGTLDGEGAATVHALDERRELGFEFQTSTNPGVHRVAMRKGGETAILDFWVGPDLVRRR